MHLHTYRDICIGHTLLHPTQLGCGRELSLEREMYCQDREACEMIQHPSSPCVVQRPASDALVFGASEVARLRLLPTDRYASAVHAVLSRNTGTDVMNTGHCSEGGEDGGIIERTERERERRKGMTGGTNGRDRGRNW